MFSDRDYLRAARIMLRIGQNAVLCRRYLSVRRREAVLAAHARDGRDGNPLARVEFAPPLSVAGEDAHVVAHADALSKTGIPVEFTTDERGLHTGDPLARVQGAMAAALGREVEPTEVLEWYGQFMRPVGESRRAAMAPLLLAEVRRERRAIEAVIDAAVEKYRRERFSFVVMKAPLGAALAARAAGPADGGVFVAFHPVRGLRVAGRPVESVGGNGSGAAVVCRLDLDGLIEIEGNVVNVECHAGHWVAFVEGFDGEQLRTSGPFRFHYYRRGHDQ